MTLINIKKIIKVLIFEERQAENVNFKEQEPAKHIFFGLIRLEDQRPPRWYTHFGEYYNSREELVYDNKHFYINYDVLYEFSVWQKPRIYIVMENGISGTVYYDTREDMYEHINDIVLKSSGVLIEIK